MNSEWSYAQNVFNNTSKSNFKRMLLMSRDHHDKLKVEAAGNPTIDALYQAFLPDFTRFKDLYSHVNSNSAGYQGLTMQLENLMVELRGTKAKRWDIMLQNVYDDTTVAYRSVFSNGRAPFQSGPYDMRIAAVQSLSANMAAYPDLAAVKVDVDAFLTNIETARTEQQGGEKRDSTLRADLEDARIALAVAMHRVFGGLIQLYADNTKKIETFYELKYLRASPSKATSGSSTGGNAGGNTVTVAAQSRATALTGTYNVNTAFAVNNTGSVAVSVFLSNDPQAAEPIDASTVAANEVISFTGDELTDGTSPMKYLIVINNNPTAAAVQAWEEM
jgi:hypothetical protein